MDLGGLVADCGLELWCLCNPLQHNSELSLKHLEQHDMHDIKAEQLEICHPLLSNAAGTAVCIVGLGMRQELAASLLPLPAAMASRILCTTSACKYGTGCHCTYSLCLVT